MFKTEGLNELQIVRAEAKAWDRDARASLLEADRILGSTPKWPIHLSTEMAVVVDSDRVRGAETATGRGAVPSLPALAAVTDLLER